MEQTARRARAKALAEQLKGLVRGTSWRIAKGVIFKDQDGWFVAVRTSVWITKTRSTVSLIAKPMAIEPLFWEIAGINSNADKPVSFRFFGAWTCNVPPSAEDDIAESTLETDACAILSWADEQIVLTRDNRSLGIFNKTLLEHPRRSAYLASAITGLILAGRYGQALSESSTAIEQNEGGGFGGGGLTFPAMAKAWLVSHGHAASQ